MMDFRGLNSNKPVQGSQPQEYSRSLGT